MLARQGDADAIRQAVAESAKPLVERDGGFTIIALKITVVEIMKIRTGGPLFFQDRTFESMMSAGGTEGGVLEVEEKVERM